MRVDTHDPAAQGHDLLHCSQRAAVIDITLAGGVVCALTKSGCCIAYDERTMKQLCYLNVVPNELIRSMYYNKEQNAVITVSVHKVDSFRSLRCRSIPVCSLFNKTPHKSTVMFANEPLAYPSFVEFDTYNDLVVTYASSSGAYKFWHMHDYSQLFQVCPYVTLSECVCVQHGYVPMSHCLSVCVCNTWSCDVICVCLFLWG